MIKAIIVEDEPKARASLEMLLRTFCPTISVVGSAPSVETGIKIINKLEPDLIFLDIQLKDGSGFDLLRYFSNFNFKIIFTTAFEEFAVKAFKLSALDYLLKPIDPEDLQLAVEKASQVITRENVTFQVKSFLDNFESGDKDKTLVLKTTDNIFLVKTDQILFCEADKNYTRFYLNNQQRILVSKTLKEYEEILGSSRFFRIHQSFFINLGYLKQVNKRDNKVLLTDGTKLPISTRKRELLFSELEKL